MEGQITRRTKPNRFLAGIAAMALMFSSKAMHGETSNPKTIERKLERMRHGNKSIGNNQRKRRKLIRQNPSLLRSKKYK